MAAGADVITTNSYAVVPFHLGQERFGREGHRAGDARGPLGACSRRRCATACPVAGCLPPLCGSYRTDLYDPVVARPILATLLDALAPSVDLWLAETLSASAEAELVARHDCRGRWQPSTKPLWLSFTLADRVAQGAAPTLRSGESVAEAVSTAARLGARAVLFNCSQPEVMGAGRRIAAQTLKELGGPARATRIGVYANAFVPLQVTTEANAELSDLRSRRHAAGLPATGRATG